MEGLKKFSGARPSGAPHRRKITRCLSSAAAVSLAAGLFLVTQAFAEDPVGTAPDTSVNQAPAPPQMVAPQSAPSAPPPAFPGGRLGANPVRGPEIQQTPSSSPAVMPRSSVTPAVPPLARPGVSGPGPVRGQAQQRLEGTAVLNFSEVSLKDILRTVSEITGENFIISPGISARISIQSTKPIPKKDVFGIFESVLEVNGLAAVKAGSYYKIVPASSAKQRWIELSTETDSRKIPPGDGIMNLIVPIEFVSANDLIQILKPMLSSAGNAVNNSKTNTIIITDIASNIKKSLELIKALDVDAFKETNISIVPVTNVDIKTFYRELSDVLAALGFGKDTTQLSIIPIERLNSFVVISSGEELLASVKEWINRLDHASSAEGASIQIYYVQNDKASNIKTILDQVYAGKKVSSPSASPAGPMSSAMSPGGPAPAPQPVRYEPTRSDAGQSEEIKIFLYEPSNAIIVQSSARDYQNILKTMKELDRPPKQVLIDALIAEVKLDESTKYGIQWSAIMGDFSVQQNTGIVSTTIVSPTGVIAPPVGLAAPSGLSILATDASRFFAVIQALASKGLVDVLSNPHIVVKNYEKASINIGSDEPVATQSTQTAITGTTGLIQSIEYRKTGVILTVTPQITEGGMVAMTLRQEVSDKSTDRTVGNAVYPSFTKREAETSIVAKDKETLVIGGLIQERRDSTQSGIPLLSRIPLLGNLFKYTTITNSKTELVILLTPRVISNSEQASVVTDEVRVRLEGLKDLLKEKQLLKGN
jgi:general secretion pathway protein D